tara:strand:+ start:22 stop:282 length:261 start_codon:yes stop_codon:yes gene_type:complete
MKELSLDTLYLGSKTIWNWIKKYIDISSKLPPFSPKKIGLYILVAILGTLYLASMPVFGPLNYVVRTVKAKFLEAYCKVFGIKFIK